MVTTPNTDSTDAPATSSQAPDAQAQANLAALSKAARLSVGLLSLLAVVAGLTRSGLSWDGSYILFSTIHEQKPFITHTRLTSNLLLAPVWLLSMITDNLTLISVVFSVLMAAVLPLSLWLCWLVVRKRRPEFFLWPALGICLVQLPGQFFYASEALIATTLMWVVVSWIAVECPRSWLPAMVALSAAILFLHPLGAVVVLAAVPGLVWRALRAGKTTVANARWWWVGAALAFFSGSTRLLAIENTGYEASSSEPKVLINMLFGSVLQASIVFLIGAVAVAFLLVKLSTGEDAGANAQRVRRVNRALVAYGLLALMAGLVWASQPAWWENALEYRSWGPILGGAFIVWALLTRPRPVPTGWLPTFAAVPPLAALLALLVLTAQGVWFARELGRADSALNSSTAVCTAVAPSPGTAMTHWSVSSLSLMLQSRQPARLLVNDPALCAQMGGDQLPIAPYRMTPRQGWFHLP